MHLERLVSLLEVIAVAGRPVSAAELQKATTWPKPTCYRLLQKLHKRKLLDQPADDSRKEFDEIVKRGFADCHQEIDLGIASVAAPISIGNIGAAFSVGAVGPIRRFEQDYCEDIGTKLTLLSQKIAGAIQLCNVADT